MGNNNSVEETKPPPKATPKAKKTVEKPASPPIKLEEIKVEENPEELNNPYITEAMLNYVPRDCDSFIRIPNGGS